MARSTAFSTRVGRYLADPVATWRTGSRESQALTLASLLVGVSLSFALSLVDYSLMPLTAYFVWLLLGTILLRFVPLAVLCATTVAMAFGSLLVSVDLSGPRITAMASMVLSVLLILFTASRQHSGLPGPMREAMLNDLRRRLQANGKVPVLPGTWTSQSAMLASNGVGYGGDFLVARLDQEQRHLELILVDVCGKGVGAASQALQFGGALGGLIGQLPPRDLLRSANDFMLRLQQHDSFATAAHVAVDLHTGDYELTSAGHPPAMVWSHERRHWRVDNASGTALGIIAEPVLESTRGVLAPGDAVMFYTDGVIEYRSTDLDVGLTWLAERAAVAVETGFPGAAERLISEVRRGDDDRAVLILQRGEVPA